MPFDVLMLAVSLGLILLASVIFTNSVEMFGKKLNIHQGATGSILAAVGTALPETVIPIIAILVYHDADAKNVGIGAIAGAPFMLGTLAFFVTGAAVLVFSALGRRTRAMHIDQPLLVRDLTFFVVLYGAAVLTTFLHEWFVVKVIVAIGLFLAYILYVKMTLASEGTEHEDVDALYICRILGTKVSTTWIVIQLLLSLGLMIWSAHMFVGYVRDLSLLLGISTIVLSMIITPIATELPEKCNSVLWIGQKKDIMALGNITGAMVFQSSFPVVFGILFTHWDLSGPPMVSAILAFMSAFLVLMWVKAKKSLNAYVLMAGGLLYAVFIAYIMLRASMPQP
ncbi:MAG: hypothetical protein C0404_06900 [Verrucomicrobia bacterium]|nr:hypothetical protein [Verrucomicrobiota bacterium]